MTINNLIKNITDIFSYGMTDWGGLHPMIIHFPIACLFVSPFFLIFGQIFKKHFKSLYISSFIMLFIGTIFMYLATSTGNYAAENLQPSADALTTLDTHIQLAEQSRLIFSILTAFFLIYLLTFTSRDKRLHPKFHLWADIIFLVIYIYGLILVFNAAHFGGKLVHKHGITSSLYSGQ